MRVKYIRIIIIIVQVVVTFLQRDMAERGHSLESIKASIEARKPDFDAYIGNFTRFFSKLNKSPPIQDWNVDFSI